MDNENRKAPRITVGEYAGTRIDKLPLSYCRWMLTQDLPEHWLECARSRVEKSPIHNEKMWVSRHAIDRFSLRFMKKWLEYKLSCAVEEEEIDGLATFVVKQARKAWEQGEDVSLNRHKDDGIIKKYEGIKYVFKQSKTYPDYLELITMM